MQFSARRQRGFTIMEGILALVLVTTALLTLLSVFTLVSSHARLSRDQVLARTVAATIQDEILAHGLGRSVLPPDYSPGDGGLKRTYEFPCTVEGRPADPLHYEVVLTPSSLGNGSFFRTNLDTLPASDVVHAKISWREAGREEQHEHKMEFDVTVVAR